MIRVIPEEYFSMKFICVCEIFWKYSKQVVANSYEKDRDIKMNIEIIY